MYMNVDFPACVSSACPGEMSIWAVSARANRAEANSYPGQPILERGCCLVVKNCIAPLNTQNRNAYRGHMILLLATGRFQVS